MIHRGAGQRGFQLTLLDYPAMEGNVELAYEREQSYLRLPVARDRDSGGWRIDSERRLARLACLLGALDYGGSLSADEQRLVAEAQGEFIAPYVIEDARQAIREGGDPLGDALCTLRPAIVLQRGIKGSRLTVTGLQIEGHEEGQPWPCKSGSKTTPGM